MNKAKIVGRKIVGIDQERTQDTSGAQIWDVKAIYLDNGTVLSLSVAELGHEYAITMKAYRVKTAKE